MQQQLTSLFAVKQWSAVTSSADDALLTSLIVRMSKMILNYINRDNLQYATFTDVIDGLNTVTIYPVNFPVLSVSSLTVGCLNVNQLGQPATRPGYGYILDPWNGIPPGAPQAVTFRGGGFPMGYSNINITYQSGFAVIAEPHTVPASGTYKVTPNQNQGTLCADNGVTYANGNPMVAVASAPTTGQYIAPTPFAATPVYDYTFSAGDASAAVLITYSYVPGDLEQACIELVSERYSYRQRIGQKTKSLGGQETMSYNLAALPDWIMKTLNPYKRVMV